MRWDWPTPLKVYALYAVAVIATFAFGVAHPHTDGWSYIFTVLLTLPWCMMPLPDQFMSFNDLPIFLLGIVLNIGVVEVIRQLLRLRRA